MKAENKATIVVEGVFRKGYETHFDEYSQKIRNLLSKYSTTVVRRQRVKQTLYGNSSIDLLMIIDFADETVAKELFYRTEYQALLPLRDQVFSTFNMYLAEAGSI